MSNSTSLFNFSSNGTPILSCKTINHLCHISGQIDWKTDTSTPNHLQKKVFLGDHAEVYCVVKCAGEDERVYMIDNFDDYINRIIEKTKDKPHYQSIHNFMRRVKFDERAYANMVIESWR